MHKNDNIGLRESIAYSFKNSSLHNIQFLGLQMQVR